MPDPLRPRPESRHAESDRHGDNAYPALKGSHPRGNDVESAQRGPQGHSGHGRRLRPAPLSFEPASRETGPEHFFDLESLDDPYELLRRSTELMLAFRAAADRATEFQAVAAAQLADPRRFDRLPPELIAERAEWTPDYAQKMIEFGRDLLRDTHSHN